MQRAYLKRRYVLIAWFVLEKKAYTWCQERTGAHLEGLAMRWDFDYRSCFTARINVVKVFGVTRYARKGRLPLRSQALNHPSIVPQTTLSGERKMKLMSAELGNNAWWEPVSLPTNIPRIDRVFLSANVFASFHDLWRVSAGENIF